MTTKVCFKCGQEKVIDEFYRHPKMADGYLGKCKQCTKDDVARNYQKNHGYYVQYEKGRASLPHRKQLHKQYAKSHPDVIRECRRRTTKRHPETKLRYRQRHPDRIYARTMLAYAVRLGKIQKQPCVVCGDPRSEGHHSDYSKPLDVVWLCNKHHHEYAPKIGELLP